MVLPKVSQVEIYPVIPKAGHVGFVSFILDDAFSINGVGIHTRLDGTIRLLYPIKHLPNGLEMNLFHPINQTVGKMIEEKVSEQFFYLKEVDKHGSKGKI